MDGFGAVWEQNVPERERMGDFPPKQAKMFPLGNVWLMIARINQESARAGTCMSA